MYKGDTVASGALNIGVETMREGSLENFKQIWENNIKVEMRKIM
jgi:hypothetical protein